MIKKLIFSMLFWLPITIYASDNVAFMIGNKAYDTLEEAILNASSTDTIELFSNAELNETLEINKKVNIDLNGNNITAPSAVFLVEGGELNISGKGTIKENEPYYGAIRVIGSSENTNDKYSVVNIEKDVTLEGWAGIFITHKENKSHGVAVYLDGTINAVSDVDGNNGVGVYVNGTIQHEEGHPVVNISDNAKIYSNGTGLYIAGYSTFNIQKAYIEGKHSGIGIKAGKLTIDGATIICNGEDTTPTEGYNNGMNSSGTTIQIESNSGYAGNIEIDISNGNLTSKNSSVIYEYIGKGDNTQVKSMSISNGTLISEAGKNVFLLSEKFKDTHSGFVSGGKFSSDPTSYLKSGYSTNLENDLYNVSKSSMAVFGEINDTNNSFTGSIFITSIIILLLIITYLYRIKIINIFKNFTK